MTRLRLLRCGLAALALGGLPGLAAMAAPVQDVAYAAYQTGFYLRAVKEATARIEADRNDAAAMTLLGEIYRQGLGVPLDVKAAAEWYRLAHERGDANASFALGMAALAGSGVPKDEKLARELLDAAAPKHAFAAYNLSILLLPSTDPADWSKAVKLLESAAAAEIAEAQHALGVLKLKGEMTGKDMAGAADLMRRAAQNGLDAGAIEYATLLFNGLGVERDEITAADYFARAAARGNALAQNRLARLYASGRGRTRDPVEAAAWNLAARRQGLADEGLDKLLEDMTDEEKTKAERLAASRAGQSLTAPVPQGQ